MDLREARTVILRNKGLVHHIMSKLDGALNESVDMVVDQNLDAFVYMHKNDKKAYGLIERGTCVRPFALGKVKDSEVIYFFFKEKGLKRTEIGGKEIAHFSASLDDCMMCITGFSDFLEALIDPDLLEDARYSLDLAEVLAIEEEFEEKKAEFGDFYGQFK